MPPQAPRKELAVESHPADDILRQDRLPHILCPGCGVGTVIHTYVEALLASGVEAKQHVCVSGIGCSGRSAGYVNIDSYHTTHGRAIPFATGIAVQNPELVVTVISGDGDLGSIGGNHLIHAARRNMSLNVICINNFTYGMTGGQAGPTTPISALSSTTPYGSFERPFNLPHLMEGVGANFVARWTMLHVRQLKDAILRAMSTQGFSFIEVMSPCPTGFGRPNKMGSPLNEMQKYNQRCVVEHDADLRNIDIDLTNTESPIVLGNFVENDRPEFSPMLAGEVRPPRSKAGWAAVRYTQFAEESNGS